MTAGTAAPRFRPLGDAGLVVEFGGDDISDAANAAVLALRAVLARARLPGLREMVPTYRSLLVVYDPVCVGAVELRGLVTALLHRVDAVPAQADRQMEIPTVYGGSYGPDLAGVAAELGLSEAEVVAAHGGTEYRVYMTGFSPGFPYMGTLPPAIRVPRLLSPRTRVPIRSVAMAGMQTGVYPTATPGGWRLLGRTPLRIYDPSRADPFLLSPGDRVRFTEISADAYASLAPVDESPPAAVPPPRADLVVEQGGLLTTVQDLGRPGYRQYGMPQGGAMDPLALHVTNLLLGNVPEAACLEFAFPGPSLVAARRTVVALGGADFGARRNGRALPLWSACVLNAGDVLSFAAPRGGEWGYLAFPGGLDVPEFLGSRATYLRGEVGGHGGRRLGRGDHVAARRRAPSAVLRLRGQAPPVGGHVEVRVVLGPQEDYFTDEAVRALLESEYRPGADVDRVGYRLDGPQLAHRAPIELLSDGILPGGIQVPRGGQPIVIMPDGPTAGGYPKIAAVVQPDLRLLAQVGRGRPFRFRAIPWQDAFLATVEQRGYLETLSFEPAAPS